MTEKSRKYKINYSRLFNFISIVVGIALWIAIVYFGYTFAKEYIDQEMYETKSAITEIKKSINDANEENKLVVSDLNNQINTLNGKIDGFKGEVNLLNAEIDILNDEIRRFGESIEKIDLNVLSTGEIETQIGNKLKALDNRLDELKESLRILQEAPNEAN